METKMYRSRVHFGIGCGILLLLGGCSMQPKPKVQTFDTYGEAVRVVVGSQTVAPFEDYIDLLQPKFSLSPAEALNLVLPQTQSVRTRELRELLLSLQLAFPQTSHSFTSETSTTGDNTTTTEVSQDQRMSPSTPETVIPDAVERSLEALAALDTSALQSDSMLRYRAATALFQEVALLSSYVRDAAVGRDAVPYIVRQLVTVLPTARRSPYDVHVTLGYFTGGGPPIPYFDTGTEPAGSPSVPVDCTCCGAVPEPVSVIPLFVTDNIETSLIQGDRTGSQNLGLAASGASTAVGFGVGARSRAESSEQSVSRELNSLLTVGRAADNVVTMRIGASFADNTYHLVPRTFNVTVLVVVPYNAANQTLPCRRVRYTVESDVSDARSGRRLPRASVAELNKHLTERFGDLGVRPSHLVEAAIANRFDAFASLLCSSLSACSPERVEQLWVHIVGEAAVAGLSGGSFELPSRQLRFFASSTDWGDGQEDSRNAVLDDGKAAVMRVSGGYGLTDGTLEGTLRFTSKKSGQTIELVASSIKVEGGGRGATVTFPSIHKIDPEATEVTVSLLYGSSEQRWSGARPLDDAWHVVLPVVAYKEEKPKDPVPEFSLHTSSDQVRVTAAGQGQLAFAFKRNEKAKADFSSISFTLRGAHIVSSVPPLGTAKGAYIANTDTIYTLSLGGLVPGSKLSLASWRLAPAHDGKKGDTHSVNAPTVELFVVGPEPVDLHRHSDPKGGV